LKLLNDVFQEIIQAQRTKQDSQALQLIKDFYQLEVSSLVRQWQGEAEKERLRRKEAERGFQQMQEELKRVRAEAKN
jgi:hypothetical protein